MAFLFFHCFQGAAVSTAIEVGLLGRYERPLPLLDNYDQLLNWGGAS